MIKKISLCVLLLSISVNASETWTVKLIHEGFIHNIFFVDEMTGWACADIPGALKTEDGGKTWKKIYFGGNGTIYAIWFVTKDKGWAVGAHVEGCNYGDSGIRVHPAIYVTNNGGKSWHLQKLLDNYSGGGDFNSVYFTDELHGFASGGITSNPGGILLYTSDGGENWTETDSQAMKEDDVSGYNVVIRDLYFIDQQQGWAMGYDLPKSKIFHTSDGGKTWSLLAKIDHWDLCNIHFTDSRNGWAVGSRQGKRNSFLRTTDGGSTWSEVSLPSDEKDDFMSSDVLFADKMHGWITGCGGDNGTLYTTQDGGNSWIKELFSTFECIRIITISKSKIFLVSDGSNIYSKPLSFGIK